MKTSEFIKLLQEADPSGEAHLRMGAGIPSYVQLKEGYWDGPYSYLNENGDYVNSMKGMKVDVYFTETEDIIERELEDNWNPYLDPIDGLWERVKEKFKFEYTYSIKAQAEEREINFLKEPEEYFNWLVEYKKNSWQKELLEMKEKANKGWKFYQVKDPKLIYYDWMILDENGKNQGANLCTTYPILKSGNFQILEDDIKGNEIHKLGFWKALKSTMGNKNSCGVRLNENKIFREWVIKE